MKVSFIDFAIKIPGFFKVYKFLRERLYKKTPPESYSPILLKNDTILSDDPRKILSVDDYGLRIESGSLSISVLKNRTNLHGSRSQTTYQVINNKMEFHIRGESITLEFYQKKQWSQVTITHNFEFSFGLAEKHGGLNKNGKTWKIWNTDVANMEPKDDPLYKSYPLLILGKLNIWIAIILDYPGYQSWDLQKNNEIDIHIQSIDYKLDIIYANHPKDLMTKIGQILGFMDLPPLWSLGYHQCRWSYFPADRVRDIVRGFRTRNIPIDAIYLDIDYMNDFRCFTWDEEGFGNLPQLINDLHSENINVIVMIDPGIKYDPEYFVFRDGVDQGMFVTKNNELFTAPVWPGKSVFPDYFNPKVKKWWGALYQEFVDLGIDAFWNDMNEPSTFNLRGTMHDDAEHVLETEEKIQHSKVHNLYGQMMVKASYEGLQKLQPNKRLFLLSRSAYIGSQNYGWIWSGDNKSSWSHLEMSIAKIMGTGLCGHFANGADIGGFRGKVTPELYARWIQMGVFYPFMRTHTMKYQGDQEPWSFGENVEKIAQNMIQLRYKLLPYIYTYFREGCVKGIPLMRPMFLEFPDDLNCYNDNIINYQFMFGPDLLIAPVVKQGSRKKNVYLPEGIWHHFFTKKKFEGGQIISLVAELDQINVFVRNNRIIPVYKNIGINSKETTKSGLDYLIFGENATGELYIDDGDSLEYQKKTFGLYKITNSLTLELIEGSGFKNDQVE